MVALTVLGGLLFYSWLEQYRRETKVELVGARAGRASGRTVAYVPYKMHALQEVKKSMNPALPAPADQLPTSLHAEGVAPTNGQYRELSGDSAAYEYPPRSSGN